MEDGGGVKWVVGVRGNLFLPSLILECGGKEPLFLARDHEINTDQGTAIQCYGLLNLFMIFVIISGPFHLE